MSLYDYYGIDVELSDRHTEPSENDKHESKIKRNERAKNGSVDIRDMSKIDYTEFFILANRNLM